MKPQINDPRMLELLHDKENLINIDNEQSEESFDEIEKMNEAQTNKYGRHIVNVQ